MYTGLEYSDSGVQAVRAVLTLWALAGLLVRMRVPNPDLRKALGRDRFPLYSSYRGESHAMALPEAALEGRPYPVRGLLGVGGSLITAWPQPAIWKKTLAALDFLAVVDRYPTADAAYADLLLPAATGFELTSGAAHVEPPRTDCLHLSCPFRRAAQIAHRLASKCWCSAFESN